MDTYRSNFVRIIEFNQGIIKSLCKAYFPDTEDQKDVFQDIVVQLWKSFASFRGESEISTWIYRVSLNTILSKVRDGKRKIATEAISTDDQKIANAMADDDTELLAITLQSLKGLDKAIVILLLEGYKYKEIVQILNITSTNLSTRLNRIKASLADKFKNHHYEFGKS